MRLSVTFIIILAFLLLASPSLAQEAQEQNSEEVAVDPQPEVIFQSPEEAALADAQAIAEATGETLEAVEAGLTHQAKLDEILRVATSRYSEIYAGAWTDNFPRSTSTIRVKGAVPVELAELAAASGEQIQIVGDAPLAWSELTGVATEVARALHEAGHQGAVTWIEVQEPRIKATVPHTSLTSAAAIQARVVALVNQRAPLATEFVTGNGLQIEMAAPGVDLGGGEHTYGGGMALDDGVRECTTAFTVNLANGDTGVLTAAHCTGINQYRQEDGLVYSMPWVDEHVGSHGDLEIHTSTHVEPDDFYANTGVLRDVSGIAPIGEFNVGDSVCVYGRTSGRDCSSQIYKLWICYYPDSRQACNLVAMDEHVTAGGDSGGPWYWGNTAWGVHSGRANIDGTLRSVFTPVFWVDNEFGATIRQ